MEKKNESQVSTRAKTWQLVLFSSHAGNLPFVFLMSFFMIFHTNVNGLVAAAVGIMMTASRLFDGVTDPLIGLVFEKMNPKYGKVRIFYIVGNTILNISWILMFYQLSTDNGILKLVWVFVFYLLYVIGYTIQGIAARAGENIITKDPKQRATIPIFQQYLGLPVIILASGFTPNALNMLGGFTNPQAWVKLVSIYALISFVSTILTMISVYDKDVPAAYDDIQVTQKKYKFRDYIGIIKQSKPLQMLIIAFSTNKFAQTANAAIGMYVFMYVIQRMDLRLTSTLVGLPLTLVFATIGGLLARRKGFKQSLIFGSWICVGIGVGAFILQPFLPIDSILVILPSILLGGTMMLVSVQTNPMVADVTDDYAWRTGNYVPAMVGMSFSFIDKMVSSISTTFLGILLTFLGIKEGAEATQTIYWGILSFWILIPVLAHLATIWAMKRYDLTREHMVKVQAELAERKSANSNA